MRSAGLPSHTLQPASMVLLGDLIHHLVHGLKPR